MEKTKLGKKPILFPMPAALVGTKKDKVNFTTIAWAGVVNSSPAMVGVSIRKSRFSYEVIKETGVFSVNIPTEYMAIQTDFCGIVSGREEDKATKCKFNVFYGELENAPMIEECILNVECRVERIIELPSHDYIIGEVVEVYMSETEEAPLIFMGSYYGRAEGFLGDAFKIGKDLLDK